MLKHYLTLFIAQTTLLQLTREAYLTARFLRLREQEQLYKNNVIKLVVCRFYYFLARVQITVFSWHMYF
mgnify:CR=1 FL=1